MPSGWRSVKERVTPTTIPASFMAGERSTGHQVAVVVEVVLDELAARDAARRGRGRSGASTLTSSAGCTEPRRRACTIRRAPSSSGCSGRVGRLVELDDHAAAGGREQPQLAVAHLAAARVAHAAADDHGLDAEALGLAGVAVDQRARLLRREVDLRPHVQPHAVPQQALARRAAGLEAAQRTRASRPACARARAARRRGPFSSRTIAELAHLGEREQPLVLRVRAADAAEQVDVRGRRDALERELRHAPQVQALGHLRVHELQVAVDLPAAVERAPQRDRVGAGDAARRRGHVEHDALDAAAGCRALERCLQAVRQLLAGGRARRRGRRRPISPCGYSRGAARRSRPRRRRGPACPRTRRRDAGGVPFVLVARRDVRGAVARDAVPERRQLALRGTSGGS